MRVAASPDDLSHGQQKGAGKGLPLFLQRSAAPDARRTGDEHEDLPVQRDGGSSGFQLTPPSLLQPPGYQPRPNLLGNYQLQLSPEIQRMMLEMALQQLDPERVAAAVSGIVVGAASTALPPAALPATPPAGVTPSPAPAGSGASPAPTTPQPTQPRLGELPAPPRPGSPGDILAAAAATAPFRSLLTGLQLRVTGDWGRLNTGEQVGVASAIAIIGLGALGGALTDPQSRQFVFSQINGRVFPVPGVPALGLEVNILPNSLMIGAHLDVGRLLGPSLGFGPASFGAIGGPPQPQPFPPAQRSSAGSGAVAADPDLGTRIQAAGPGGRAVQDPTLGHLEQGLGADLSGIKVHTDGEADQLAQAVDAVAFTSGRDIFFRSGAYNPGSAEGMRLLAHEATHTVQQASGPVDGTPTAGGLWVSNPGDRFEQAAEHAGQRMHRPAGEKATHHGSRLPSASAQPSSSFASVQRKGKGGDIGPATAAGTGGATGSEVGIAGGESTTPSEQTGLAAGYVPRADGRYDTPDGRTISAEQAQAESRVINSAGIFMGAYLALLQRGAQARRDPRRAGQAFGQSRLHRAVPNRRHRAAPDGCQ